MNRTLRGVISLFLIVVLWIAGLTGCESFRRKFVRQKKADKKSEIIPVLDPIEYPPYMQTAADRYKHAYGLWLIWQKDLITSIQDDINDKRKMYLINQLINLTGEMQSLVSGDKQDGLKNIFGKLQRIKKQLEAPTPLRNYVGIQLSLERLGKELRNNYKMDLVKDQLALPETTP